MELPGSVRTQPLTIILINICNLVTNHRQKTEQLQVIVLENQILQDALKWAYQASPKHLNTR